MPVVSTLSPQLGALLHADPGEQVADLDEQMLIRLLRDSGVLVFRDFPASPEVFQSLTERFSSEFLQHGISNRPQLKEGDNYTNLANIGQFPLILHSEMSYFPVSPQLLWFYCVTPAESNGETTLCDGSELLSRMTREHVAFFRQRRLMYTYPTPEGESGFFGRFSPDDVNHRLQAESSFEYRRCPTAEIMDHLSSFYPASVAENLRPLLLSRADNFDPVVFPSMLMVKYITPAIRRTRLSEKEAFVNSAIQFFPNKRFHSLIYDETGAKLDASMMAELLELAEECTYAHPWQEGDMVMIDNTRVLHGRREFQDTRRTIQTRMSMANFD
ncbi:TauD/TfdA family dioxygenase [Haliea sp. E1-2-M8]|uniref:TauD/TfdA family dioxygenase n=1 Tax=Haliea sp. E1-2-M8 TaxID=3064706 RepID=UPI0027267FB3|nr:TauD/TfdA family dioxygenase [Haliea sp. E1-2-M8]MDO8861563.1 TauD/TfdA family dioxygenase [Haliea sp. E1-2-M8]